MDSQKYEKEIIIIKTRLQCVSSIYKMCRQKHTNVTETELSSSSSSSQSLGFENGRVREFWWIPYRIGRIVSASSFCVLGFPLDLVRLRLFLDRQYLEKPPFSGHFSSLFVS